MPKRREYAPNEIEHALGVLAFYGGNSIRASEATGIEASVLRRWKLYKHPDLYRQIQEREGPKLEQLGAAQARETIIRAGEAEADLFDLLNQRIHEANAPQPQREDHPTDASYEQAHQTWLKRGSPKELSELAGTIQRVSTAKGINGTKLLELTGRPTQIIEHREGDDILKALATKIPGLVINSTATELPTPTQPQALSPASHTTEPLLTETHGSNAREPVQTAAD